MFEGGGGVRDGHGGLVGEVGLVEAHDILAAAAEEHGFDVGHEVGDGLGAPEHGNELDAVREGAAGGRGPVVGPGDGAVYVEVVHGVDIGVCGTALGLRARLIAAGATQWRGQGKGRRRQKGGRKKVLQRDHIGKECKKKKNRSEKPVSERRE